MESSPKYSSKIWCLAERTLDSLYCSVTGVEVSTLFRLLVTTTKSFVPVVTVLVFLIEKALVSLFPATPATFRDIRVSTGL